MSHLLRGVRSISFAFVLRVHECSRITRSPVSISAIARVYTMMSVDESESYTRDTNVQGLRESFVHFRERS